MTIQVAAEAHPRRSAAPFSTNIPARLDRLPWSRFHWLVVWALGITWILDGLEVTLIGAVSGVLQEREVMNFTPAVIGFIASTYLMGAVSGSLVFGYLTDRWGRKRRSLLLWRCTWLASCSPRSPGTSGASPPFGS